MDASHLGSFGFKSNVELPGREVGQHRHLCVKQAQVEVPAEPGSRSLNESRANCECGRETATMVYIRDGCLPGWPVRLAGETHNSRGCLDRVRPIGRVERPTNACPN
jgi:hypothetical protein